MYASSLASVGSFRQARSEGLQAEQYTRMIPAETLLQISIL